MTAQHRARRHRRLAAVPLAATLVVAGCGGVVDDEDSANPIEDPGAEVEGGNPAPDEAVSGTVEVNALQLAFPEDGLHEEGSDVPLYAALSNTGTADDRLLDVTGPDFADARLTATDGSEGAIVVGADDNAYLEPEGPPSVTLLDLATSLRSSQSVQVTFVFEEAGEVTLEAPVAPEPPGQGDFTPSEDVEP
ncbi:copper chaperone PCu(A)C [Geodermatophilus sp. SYSU D00697]